MSDNYARPQAQFLKQKTRTLFPEFLVQLEYNLSRRNSLRTSCYHLEHLGPNCKTVRQVPKSDLEQMFTDLKSTKLYLAEFLQKKLVFHKF